MSEPFPYGTFKDWDDESLQALWAEAGEEIIRRLAAGVYDEDHVRLTSAELTLLEGGADISFH